MGLEQLFYIGDMILIVYITIQFVLLNILRLEWAENHWSKDGSGYVKQSTRPDKIRCWIKIGICVLLLIASTLVQHYIFDLHHLIDPNHLYDFHIHTHGPH